MFLLFICRQHSSKTTKTGEKVVGVIWPQSGMMVKNTPVAYSSTQCYISTMLARDFNNGSLANYIPASPSLGEIEASFINKKEFMGSLHGIQFKWPVMMMMMIKMMKVSCGSRLALTAVLMLLTGGARGIRMWKEGPKVRADGTEYKAAGFRSEEPPAVRVHCTESRMVVRARADLYGTGRLVTASELRLGPDFSKENCGPVRSEDAGFVITAGLHECGAELRVEDDTLVYANTLFHTPTLNRFGIIRSAGMAIPLECRYKRTHFVSSNSQSKPVSLALLSSAPTAPVSSPHFMTGDSISERMLDMLQSTDISMVASVLSAHHSALKLFLDRCVVTLESDTAAISNCDFINYHGCPGDSGSAKSTVSSVPWEDCHVLRLKLDLPHSLRHNGHPDSSMFVTCWMKNVDPVQENNSGNEECSYTGNSWHSVDGKRGVQLCNKKCDVFRQRSS
ncbi:zona pellucida sperm-binding protein 3-like [Neoarius graeffei]|uniref:zona pellucida sperm-binding protein 3-like n=1 Tax=Neoarius graeffei TaxID=443677 RepID=UPI00298C9380|nr:zona pellucida sperm-binding protein 3-like [Neoarius graeffei]